MLFFAIPADAHDGSARDRARSLLQKLARVDYAGALTLVRTTRLFIDSR